MTAWGGEPGYPLWVTMDQRALFSAIEIQFLAALRTGDGRNQYRLGPISPNGRRGEARALITRAVILGDYGTPANRRIIPPGFNHPYGRGAGNHVRRHLIADMLGGPGDDPANIVCLDQLPTNRSMEDLELAIRDAALNGEDIYLAVSPVYSGHEAPIGVTLKAVGDRGYYLYVTIANRNQPRRR